MHCIELNNLKFFAHHGIHDEEAFTGTDFEVNIKVGFEENNPIHSLSQTINYAEVYEVISGVFNKPVKLLETLTEDAIERIRLLDSRIKFIEIRVTKLNAPIRNFIGNVSVSYSKSF